jgi:hypothetical protein
MRLLLTAIAGLVLAGCGSYGPKLYRTSDAAIAFTATPDNFGAAQFQAQSHCARAGQVAYLQSTRPFLPDDRTPNVNAYRFNCVARDAASRPPATAPKLPPPTPRPPEPVDAARVDAFVAWVDCALRSAEVHALTSTERAEIIVIGSLAACSPKETTYVTLSGTLLTPARRAEERRLLSEQLIGHVLDVRLARQLAPTTVPPAQPPRT